MTEFALEIAKIKRRRVLPIVLTLAFAGVGWPVLALSKMFNGNKVTVDAVTVLSQYLMVLPLVVPLMVAVLVVRVAGAEQEKGMFTRLVTAGASRTRLWVNKLLLIAGFLVVAHLIAFVAVTGFGATLGASIDVELTKQRRGSLWFPIASFLLGGVMVASGLYSYHSFTDTWQQQSMTWSAIWANAAMRYGGFLLPILLGIHAAWSMRMEHSTASIARLRALGLGAALIRGKVISALIANLISTMLLGNEGAFWAGIRGSAH